MRLRLEFDSYCVWKWRCRSLYRRRGRWRLAMWRVPWFKLLYVWNCRTFYERRQFDDNTVTEAFVDICSSSSSDFFLSGNAHRYHRHGRGRGSGTDHTNKNTCGRCARESGADSGVSQNVSFIVIPS